MRDSLPDGLSQASEQKTTLTRDQMYQLLREAGTATISDVLDALGHEPQVLATSLRAIGLAGCFVGPAYTITGRSERYVGGDPAKLSAIDQMPPSSVAMWAGEDAEGVCCFGDLLANAMQVRGCAAAVVDGGVRDTKYLAGLQMPVVARYVTPAQGIGRWRVTASQVAVRMRGALAPWVVVEPGDPVVGDDDGVLVVPAKMLKVVAEQLETRCRSDNAARNEILDGLPLLDALAKYGHL